MTEKNWPSFKPLIHHDIDAAIDGPHERALVHRSYNLWKFYALTLVANLVAVIGLATTGLWGSMVIGILLAVLYLLILPVVDFLGRHWNLYNGFRSQSPMSIRLFFLAQALFIFFDFFIGIGLFAGGGGGIIAMTRCFQNSKYVAGVLSAICVVFVFTLAGFNVVLFIEVYKAFKGRGWPLLPGGKS
ncbi:4392_t:CDS:2 [Ambispora gerdemannii]|uniref:4392_t:CDS:1 n=1 Tax=Ambispora gerdemannii TaxID=144530 RepID=A0A9N9G8E7_9GLOM|nr:4392_t:CDS:2 [Ambispora gerdemannii]